MPVMDGLTLLRHMRADDQLRVLFPRHHPDLAAAMITTACKRATGGHPGFPEKTLQLEDGARGGPSRPGTGMTC